MKTNTAHHCGDTADAVATTAAHDGDPGPFLTLEQAGRLAGDLGARWVQEHLVSHAHLGAPAIIALPSNGSSRRRAATLVDRRAWEAWIRSFEVQNATMKRTAPDAGSNHGTPFVPAGLLSPTTRRRAARRF